jgi:hypothetical protein
VKALATLVEVGLLRQAGPIAKQLARLLDPETEAKLVEYETGRCCG